MSSVQVLTDHIDQLDLALDQLAMRDRNFDRFALMLVDNVVELTLHQHAVLQNRYNSLWGRIGKPKVDEKAVAAALGRHFDAKVRFARSTGFVSEESAQSLVFLHGFRNTAYHAGLRHERILHALALFYFRIACALLSQCNASSASSGDRVSHRATKYVGPVRLGREGDAAFQHAWKRLREVADSMGDSLGSSLALDMNRTVKGVDQALTFLHDDGPDLSGQQRTRDEVVLDCQAWRLAFTDEVKRYAAENGCPDLNVREYVDWILAKYPFVVRKDPIPRWLERVEDLRSEKSPHVALKKYCEFMRQTEEIREQIHRAAELLDAAIQEQIDAARGK